MEKRTVRRLHGLLHILGLSIAGRIWHEEQLVLLFNMNSMHLLHWGIL